LGKFGPTAFLRKEYVFIVLKSYFDRSGQEDEKFVTLAGIAARDDLWADIEHTWEYMLHCDNPKAKYMHMREAVFLRDEFSPAKGWDDKKVGELINFLVSYITGLQLPKYCQFFCSVDMNAYRKLQAESYQMDSVVDICNSYCVERVMDWYLWEYKGGCDLEASYYFDQGEPFEPVFKAKWERETDSEKKLSIYGMWSHIKHVGSLNMRVTPGLQIADMLAWGHNREAMAGERYQHIALTMKRLAPTKGIIWDEVALRKRYRPLIYKPYEKY
jgi:hypothetical protein